MLTSTLKVLVASLFLSSISSVLVAGSSNSSQNVIANAAGDTALDQAKVNKYKSLLDSFAGDDDDKFTEAFKWTDVLDDYAPLNADCSARCLTCAPGCNPSCCAAGISDGGSNGGSSKPAPPAQSLRLRSPLFPGRPSRPLACPCFCQAGCPPIVQAVCCFTPGGNSRVATSSASDPAPEAEPAASGVPADHDTPEILLDNVSGSFTTPRNRIWGRSDKPLACPCFCTPSCPAYIQAVCCFPPGTSGGRSVTTAPKTHETLSMITATQAGAPVSVLAAVNLTVHDSFITFNLVQGLDRADHITYNDKSRTFEITLGVVARLPGKEVTLAQTFVVLDGSRLLEEEQILVGAGFLGRVGGVAVEKGVLTSLQEGLPVLTGLGAATE